VYISLIVTLYFRADVRSCVFMKSPMITDRDVFTFVFIGDKAKGKSVPLRTGGAQKVSGS